MLSSTDLLAQLVVERMLAAWQPGDKLTMTEPVRADLEDRARSMFKSAVFRRFVAAKQAFEDLLARSRAGRGRDDDLRPRGKPVC